LNPKTNKSELLHIVWEQMGVRACPSTPVEQLHDFLQYKTDEVPNSALNPIRDKLTEYIKENRNKLSLPCDGNCYNHHDGVVVYCHSKLMEEKNYGD